MRRLSALSEKGGLAQLGEHLLCKQGVVGSIPSSSTNLREALGVRREEQKLLTPHSSLLTSEVGCSLTKRKK